MNFYRCGIAGGGGVGGDSSHLLFKNGNWYNQDIIEITAPNTSIDSGKLVINGSSGTVAGIVVSDVSGLTENDYILEITCDFTGTIGGPLQYGTCIPTENLYDILAYGTNRRSFVNYTLLTTDTTMIFAIKTKSLNGIFFGMESTGCITEIRFMQANKATAYLYD